MPLFSIVLHMPLLRPQMEMILFIYYNRVSQLLKLFPFFLNLTNKTKKMLRCLLQKQKWFQNHFWLISECYICIHTLHNHMVSSVSQFTHICGIFTKCKATNAKFRTLQISSKNKHSIQKSCVCIWIWLGFFFFVLIFFFAQVSRLILWRDLWTLWISSFILWV